jgi:hypothetical protein
MKVTATESQVEATKTYSSAVDAAETGRNEVNESHDATVVAEETAIDASQAAAESLIGC